MEETVKNEDVFAVMEAMTEADTGDNSDAELLNESVERMRDLMLGK